MNQQKTGALLKRLRKEKGLTQEQLAELFYISSRTVSRWETGSNMPDVGMLVELADFYHVDIREIIDGERKGENMDHETKNTLKKVAAYAAEKERATQVKGLYLALGMAVAALVCAGLFIGYRYGIVPEPVCTMTLGVIFMVAGAFLIAFLRILWTIEKPAREPERSVKAVVTAKEVKSGTSQSGRSMMGYSFVVAFRTEDGETLELYTYEIEYGGLQEGMKGLLTYRGRYFVSFEEST